MCWMSRHHPLHTNRHKHMSIFYWVVRKRLLFGPVFILHKNIFFVFSCFKMTKKTRFWILKNQADLLTGQIKLNIYKHIQTYTNTHTHTHTHHTQQHQTHNMSHIHIHTTYTTYTHATHITYTPHIHHVHTTYTYTHIHHIHHIHITYTSHTHHIHTTHTYTPHTHIHTHTHTHTYTYTPHTYTHIICTHNIYVKMFLRGQGKCRI